ncbi:MAG: MerR family transcriptional regulator [Pseudomonadota bacterium]
MNTPRNTWSISELAQEFGVTTRAIRHYEEQGLLLPARRGQTRVYSPADRVKLILILRGNRLGFTLAESREMIGLYDPASGNVTQLERLLAKLTEKRTLLERQLEDIRQMQKEFDDVEKRCREELAAAQRQSAPAKGAVRRKTTRKPA